MNRNHQEDEEANRRRKTRQNRQANYAIAFTCSSMQTMKTLALCLAICMIALTGAMGAFANEQQPGSSIEHSIVDSNLGPMQLDPSGALAAAAADDLIAAESAQSPSAPDASDAQHKAFTSGQPLRQVSSERGLLFRGLFRV